MGLIFSYSYRNLLTRRLTTFLTASGMAMVVFVFAALVMLAEGLQQTLVETGSSDNMVVIRRSANSEVQSGISRDESAVIETQPEIATDIQGRQLLAKELVVLITLRKRDTSAPANVTLRGTGQPSLSLRPQIKIMEGRLPRVGSSEIMVGQSIARQFQGAQMNDSLFFGMRPWKIVGIFSAGSTGFTSEIWGDVDQFMQTFRRPAYSSVLFRLKDPSLADQVKTRLEADPRLTVEAKRETVYYREQSDMMAKFLRIMGTSLTIVFSIGAVVGAMITMYAAVGSRTGEIGTLRALGFQRSTILRAFLMESLFLGLLGGASGLFFATFLQFFRVSTTNFQTFSELAFRFTLSPGIVLQALGFSLFMGFAGGILPALRASRMEIVEALREV